MGDAVRIRAKYYPREIARPILFLLRVIREWWWALWYGKVFPIIPGRIVDHGRTVGLLANGDEIAGKALAALTLAGWETLRLMIKWQKGVLAWLLVFGLLWSGMAWAGLFHDPLAWVMEIAGEIALAAGGLVWVVLFPIGFLRARAADRFPGLRAFFLTRAVGTPWLEPLTVNSKTPRKPPDTEEQEPPPGPNPPSEPGQAAIEEARAPGPAVKAPGNP